MKRVNCSIYGENEKLSCDSCNHNFFGDKPLLSEGRKKRSKKKHTVRVGRSSTKLAMNEDSGEGESSFTFGEVAYEGTTRLVEIKSTMIKPADKEKYQAVVYCPSRSRTSCLSNYVVEEYRKQTGMMERRNALSCNDTMYCDSSLFRVGRRLSQDPITIVHDDTTIEATQKNHLVGLSCIPEHHKSEYGRALEQQEDGDYFMDMDR